MANIKSAKKRIAVNEKKNLQNRASKSETNTLVKKFKNAVAAAEFALAAELLKNVMEALDKAAQSSIIHKNKADRQKGTLSKMLSDAQAAKKK
jgi:small subunit ribosomal protein S20